ncbi:unannotated protein [freshwater metagenome]|uniref:Unannotated protein n=1 Tax=freshwater metagenome TaxID=449393 RepID=A0A6J6BPQ7_9ZZZZ
MVLGRDDGGVEHGVALAIEWVPHGNGHTEEALARDQPVAVESADPVVVTHPHEVGVEVDLLAAFDETCAKVFVLGTVTDVPLAGRDDLEGLVTLLEKLDGVGDGLGFANHLTRFLQHLDYACLRREHGFAGEFGIDGTLFVGLDTGGRFAHDAAVESEHRASRKAQFAPPDDVRDVTERTDHCDTASLVDLGERVGEDWNLDPEQRRADGGSEERLVALVFRVGNKCHTRRNHLGSGRLDVDGSAIGLMERDAVVGTGNLFVLEFGLGDRRAERDVPQGRRVRLIRLAARKVSKERALCGSLRLVGNRAVRL